MKNINIKLKYLLPAAFVSVFCACRKDVKPIPEVVSTLLPPNPNSSIKGLYVLNEGNLGSNKASLDYLDFIGGQYHKDIYNQENPSITEGLGDVGNDIGIYGSKLYAVINNSNKVEILAAGTGKRITQVNIQNCRDVLFNNGKAYVSAYLGIVGDPNAPDGAVYEIDTASLQITRKVTVGRQPDGLAIVNGKIYVANSGGYSPPNYEHTLSVIDLVSFKVIKTIDVAINLDEVKPDAYGNLYVTSRGDYYNIPPDLYVIDTQADTVKKDFKLPVSNIWIAGDTAYMYSVAFSYLTGKNSVSYSMIDVKTETVLTKQFITGGTDKQIVVPYGIAVNPVTGEVYVADAKDYVTPGTLYCFDINGKKEWSVTTGDIPGHFAFLFK
jgi:DNA-binding beta-propeller fold protein YncE